MLRYTIAAAVATGAYASLDASYKPASDFTKAEIAESVKNLNFSDCTMYEEVDRGFVVAPNTTRIVDTSGENVAIDSDAIIAPVTPDSTECPDTVNPSTWRQVQFLTRTGVYKVQDRVYQVRGMDLTTMTIIEASERLIVVDPLGSSKPAKIAFGLYMTHVGPHTGANLTLHSVIFPHSHIDHFGGVLGLAPEESFTNRSIQVVAPLNFVEEALSENFMVAGSMF